MLGWLVALSLAQTPSVITLRHSAGPGTETCPDQPWLEGNVSARLGYSPFAPTASRSATTRFDCSADGCRAELELTDERSPPRRRTLALQDCRELAESLALTLALAIDPVRATTPRPVPASVTAPPPPAADAGITPLPPPAAPPPAAPPPAAPPPAAPAPALATQIIGVVFVHGAAGIAPHVAAGARVGFGLRHGSFGITVEGRADLPTTLTVTGGSISTSTMLGAVAPCVQLRVGVGFCAVATVGAIQVDGRLAQGARSSSVVALVGARLSWEHFFLPWLGISAQATLQGLVTRVTVTASGAPAWVTAPVAGDIGAGVVFRY